MLDNKKFYIKTIPLEIKLKDEQHPRYNKLLIKSDELNRIDLVHNRGSIAIARSNALDSGSTQFYIALKNLPELDGRYAVFGKVLEGMNVVDSIQQGDLILKIKTFKL